MKKIIAVLSLITLLSCGLEKETKEQNKLVVTQDNYYIYYDNQILEINNGTYITTENKIDDYFYMNTLKSENQLLKDLSKYFPHGINAVIQGNKPDKYNVMPVIKIDDKSIIDSIKLADLLIEADVQSLININTSSDLVQVKQTDQVKPEISLESKHIEILNANGVNGFAKKLGEAFKNNLKMDYNAENYNKSSDLSYIINHKLSEEEFSKLVNSISIKYLKLLDDKTIKPNADVVIITGNDNKVKFPINIVSKSGDTELKNLLEEYQVKLKKSDSNEEIKEIVIKHKKEDVLIAKKLLSYIPEAKLEEDESIKEGITILTTR